MENNLNSIIKKICDYKFINSLLMNVKNYNIFLFYIHYNKIENILIYDI